MHQRQGLGIIDICIMRTCIIIHRCIKQASCIHAWWWHASCIFALGVHLSWIHALWIHPTCILDTYIMDTCIIHTYITDTCIIYKEMDKDVLVLVNFVWQRQRQRHTSFRQEYVNVYWLRWSLALDTHCPLEEKDNDKEKVQRGFKKFQDSTFTPFADENQACLLSLVSLKLSLFNLAVLDLEFAF